MKNKKNRFFNFLVVTLLIIFAVIVFFYCFPSVGKQTDEVITRFLERIFNCKRVIKIFTTISEYANFVVNKAFYLLELALDNINGAYNEVKKISPVIFASAATFPCERANFTSFYGERINPISNKKEIHTGVDIAGGEGENVYAAWPGIIFETGNDKIYGNYIIIRHASNFTTKYCHLKKINKKVGEKVSANEMIGSIGSTGQATGNHLHFEVKIDGKSIDPMECFEIC